ncbi:MAG TPA: DUF1697 domain-containing protein [Dermatophilaceae bacterium]|nr:DUF1697 domain-containing protein [Dermatophilaceae bacterium]
MTWTPVAGRSEVGLRSASGPLLGAAMLSTFLVAMDATILSTAVPAVVGDLGGFTAFPCLRPAHPPPRRRQRLRVRRPAPSAGVPPHLSQSPPRCWPGGRGRAACGGRTAEVRGRHTGAVGVRVVLLRAVNVGGAKLPMADLRRIAEQLGAVNVSTYIASGNLICAPPGTAEAFDRALEQAVQREFGYFREAISRTPAQLRQALDAHPFEVLKDSYSYISFLLAAPTPAAVAKAAGLETFEDRCQVIGSELHIRYAAGAGKAQMNTNAIGRALGVPGTARNLTTVRKLVELAS